MSPAVASLLALLVAIALSFSARVNVGVAALALAFLLGLALPGLRAEGVAAAFPSSLFLTLLGVTLLFAATEANGTLARVAARAVRLARGDARVVPWLLFAVAFVVSAVGAGAVPSVALVAPLAAKVAARMGLSPFIGALFVANGANAGNLSPLSAVGIIANSRMAEAGVGGHEAKVFAAPRCLRARPRLSTPGRSFPWSCSRPGRSGPSPFGFQWVSRRSSRSSSFWPRTRPTSPGPCEPCRGPRC